jgi:hypothetical protein
MTGREYQRPERTTFSLPRLDETTWRARFKRPWARRRYPLPSTPGEAEPSDRCEICRRQATNDPEADLNAVWVSQDGTVLCPRCYRLALRRFES